MRVRVRVSARVRVTNRVRVRVKVGLRSGTRSKVTFLYTSCIAGRETKNGRGKLKKEWGARG